MVTHLLLLRLWTLIILSPILIQPASAQWSDNIIRNLVIDDRQDEQVLPLIVSNIDKGCYISWFDHSSGTYQLFVQRLDERGNKLWGEDGLLVSSNQQDTWLTGYDMIADRNGNLIITFADTRQGIQNVFAYKISPDKEFLWGTDGIRLSESDIFEHSPRVVETSDGRYMFAWEVIYDEQSSGVLVQKLTKDGEKVFSNGNLTISSFMPKNCYSRIVPSDNGSAIVAFMSYDSDTLVKENDMVLTVQKVNSSGDIMFPVDNPIKLGVEIQNAGGIIYYIRPTIISDGNNGAFISWYEDRDFDNVFTVYLQHINSQGRTSFKLNGVPASTLAGNEMLNPQIVYNPQTYEPLLFWRNHDKTVNNEGGSIRCQKFNMVGKPVFGESGKNLFTWLLGNDVLEYKVVPTKSGIYFLFLHNESGNPSCGDPYTLKCMFINYTGESQWLLNIVKMSEGSPKLNLDAVIDASDVCKSVWCDKKQDEGGIYAQNINPDGSLGNKSTGVDDIDYNKYNFSVSPNPVSTNALFKYYLPNNNFVTLRVYDLLGNEITTLVNEFQYSGSKSILWSVSSKVNAGMYMYKLQSGNETLIGKFIVQ